MFFGHSFDRRISAHMQQQTSSEHRAEQMIIPCVYVIDHWISTNHWLSTRITQRFSRGEAVFWQEYFVAFFSSLPSAYKCKRTKLSVCEYTYIPWCLSAVHNSFIRCRTMLTYHSYIQQGPSTAASFRAGVEVNVVPLRVRRRDDVEVRSTRVRNTKSSLIHVTINGTQRYDDTEGILIRLKFTCVETAPSSRRWPTRAIVRMMIISVMGTSTLWTEHRMGTATGIDSTR